MNVNCLVVEFSNRKDARVALEILFQDGFSQGDISLVTKGDEAQLEELDSLKEGATEKDMAGSTGVGALLGGAFSAPIAASTMVGPFILVGPLVGVGLGAAVGSLLSGTQEWGVDRTSAEQLEQRVAEGSTLVMIHGDKDELRRAEASLKTIGPVSQQRFAAPEPSTTENQ